MKRSKLVYLFAVMLIALLAVGTYMANDDPKSDVSPYVKFDPNYVQADTIPPAGFPYPTAFNFNYALVPGMNGGTVGAMFFNDKYYFNRWNSTSFYRYNGGGPGGGPSTLSDSGTYVGSCRDLASDGVFLYGGNASTTLYRFDPATMATLKTFTLSGGAARAVAWDPNRKGFWNTNFGGNIFLHDTNGVLVTQITSALAGKYGMAFDSLSSPDSAFLWVWNQGSSSTTNELAKIHIASGNQVALYTFTLTASSVGIAGGFELCKVGSSYLLLANWQNQALTGYKLKDAGPTISHTALPNTQNVAGPYAVNAVIAPPAGSTINYAKIFWSRNNVNLTDSITMTGSGNNWSGSIPGNNTTATYRYQIIARDNMNRQSQTGVNLFYAIATDTTRPVITHTAIGNVPKAQWPAMVNCTATDLFGIDSVWVRWYKNSTSTGWKRFNLAKGSGNGWSGLFNSDTSQVAINDSIFYRIIARDNSNQHVMDSTALYKFKIVNQVTVTVGNGTTSSNFPFTTYWMDGRTQYLYLASDLNLPSGYITHIGFDVLTAQTQVMNEFTISMQNTTMTGLTGFVETGWSVRYGPTGYTVPGTGWQMIELTLPFYYTAGSNLLIDICYNNSSYTQFSTVNCTAAPNMYWGRYGDLSTASGCGYTAWTLTTAPVGRANTRFTMNPGPVGVENNLSNIPSTYALSQNYPNPFNPVTKINFAIPKSGFVSLKIYDILGREIRTLVNEVKQPGYFTVEFNASEFASGAYFYRLESGSFSDVKKMMLIK